MSSQWIDQLLQWVENNNDQWIGVDQVLTSSGIADIGSYIRSFIRSYSDMATEISPILPSDVAASIHGFDTRELPADIYGWAYQDLLGVIDAHLPSDLQAIMRVIETRDLPSNIVGEWWHSQLDLSAKFHRIWDRKYKNLQALLHGWAIIDLPSYVNAVYYYDITASIMGGLLKDLAASIGVIPPSNMQGIIHGFAIYDLPALLNGGYGPSDLQSYINSVTPSDLAAYIGAYKGIEVPFNLSALIEGGYSIDLPAYMVSISPIDLLAYINPVLKALDLKATIIPSTIMMKRIILVPLLEHKNLNAIVNFMCFNSAYSDLSAYTYALHKMDLQAYVIGWFGSTSDNLKDLTAYINTETHVALDTVTLSYIPEIDKYTRLNLLFRSVDTYITWDTFGVEFSNYYIKNLIASIVGVPNSTNLSASLNATWDWNFSQLPEYIKPKTHEVFINIEKLEEQWKRFVELMFDRDGREPFKYFYVDGTQKVYKVDRSRHWTIWADGYSRVDDSMIERVNVRRKFIFKMSDYTTIDEAIRDLIERAAYPISSDIGAYIDGCQDIYLDINASINSVYKYRWIKHLKAEITAV